MGNPRALPLAFRMSFRPAAQFTDKIPMPALGHSGTGTCTANRFLFCSALSRDFCTYRSKNADNRGSRNPLPWLAASIEGQPRRVLRTDRTKAVRSSWELSAEKLVKEKKATLRIGERRGSEPGDEEVEAADKPRWYDTREKFSHRNRVEFRPERPEVRRWDKQEAWGRNAWNEARESTVPKMAGEGIYGVGPVLAALSAKRREFYALYVQENIDISSNNKRKKDKKGWEKIMKIAEKIGLTLKEVSKHDLNMVVDNRPHQGLVLDASPLEMVGIKELEPVSGDEESGPLWLALDEVTDPQNLGAIIRSAYFFGASGVVLCAKNSAPLSGVVSKASAGSLELVELRSCKNMMQFLSLSAGNNWRILGASVSSRALPLSEVVPGAPTVLVLGSEGTGLRPLVERSCTDLIRIPGNQPVDLAAADDVMDNADQEFRSFMAVESLNVSVAAGVLLNHLIGMK